VLFILFARVPSSAFWWGGGTNVEQGRKVRRPYYQVGPIHNAVLPTDLSVTLLVVSLTCGTYKQESIIH
jgi:hypothetical protein